MPVDTRPRITQTGKPLNLEQLSAELGGKALCASATEIVAAEGVNVTAAQMQTAYDAHVADPLWVNPADSQAVAQRGRTLDAADALTQLIAQAGGTAAVRSKLKNVLAGTDSFTNTQAQRLLAALALWALKDRTDS